MIFINRNGLRWRDAPAAYGAHKTVYSRWKRWSENGIFARMMAGLAAEHGEEKTVMIDATYLKAPRTAISMAAKQGAWSSDQSHQRRHDHQAARCHGQGRRIDLFVTAGQVSDCIGARALLSGLPNVK
ncbi:transposase [Paracoccus ravus]|uniref:transposase n=1 Tax=Paracoccus ravus TaxID=2447760 RepID=UPI00314541DB